MRVRLPSLGLGLFVLTGACTPEKEDSTADTSTSTSTGSATDSASSTPTSGDASTATGDDPTTDDATSVAPTGGGSSSEASSGATESADTGGAVPACEAVCANLISCGLARAPDDCASACNAELEGQQPACAAATENYFACLGTLTCEQLVADTNGEPNPCTPAEEMTNVVCADDGCAAIGVSGGGTCRWSVECPGEPELRMECDTETCTCTAGGEPTGSCPAESICEGRDLAALEAKFAACCEF